VKKKRWEASHDLKNSFETEERDERKDFPNNLLLLALLATFCSIP
jgi:hypothetical protein